MSMKFLAEYIDRVNNLPQNIEILGVPFDLAWKWVGNGDEPLIEVYEKADRHTLAIGSRETIIENLKIDLPSWGLVDPDA